MSRSRSSKDAPPDAAPPDRKRNKKAQRAGARASDAAEVAGGVLADELAAGIDAARPVARRLSEEQRVDEKELGEVVARARSNIHELVALVDDRMKDLQSEDVQSLSNRLMTDAHDVADLLMDMLGAAPTLINRAAGTDGNAED